MAWFKDWFNTPYYHLLYGERDEREAEQFIQELVAFLKPEKGSVFLDLACGKGRHANDIASYGFTVYGVDLSCESIYFAQKSKAPNVHFSVHDMRQTFKPDFFNYIVNLFTSFGYFEDKNDNLMALDAVVNDLKNGGIFIQDYFNASKVLKSAVPLYHKEVGGIHFEIQKEIFDTCIVKSISFQDKGQKFNFTEKVSLFKLQDFEEMYSKVGLQILHTFGDYSLNPFNKESSDRLLIISKKV